MTKVRANIPNRPRCAARRTDGKPCGAYAHEGSDFCLWHDPSKKLEAQQTRSKAGKVKAGRDLAPGDSSATLITLATPADALAILQQGMNDLLKLENSVSRARAVFAGVSAFAKLYESSIMQDRLTAIEERLKEIESQKSS